MNRQSVSDGVFPVLGLAVLLNYIDRANLATAAPVLQDELEAPPNTGAGAPTG